MLLYQEEHQPRSDAVVDGGRERKAEAERRERLRVGPDVRRERSKRYSSPRGTAPRWFAHGERDQHGNDKSWRANDREHGLPGSDGTDQRQRPALLGRHQADDPAADEVGESRADEDSHGVHAHRAAEPIPR